MKKKNKIDEATIEASADEIKTLKATNAVDKDDTIKVVDDEQENSSYTNTSIAETDAVIEPQDKATIKYLSNVKDPKTGEISKPFTIKDKNYQLVRGLDENKEVVMAVYCLDDVNEAGENIIHSAEYFEENIAKKAITEDSYDYAASEVEYNNKEELMDYLNLQDVVGFKHFFVDISTGEIVAKFKNTRGMIESGIKLGDGHKYMTPKSLKKFRFGDYFDKSGDGGMNEETDTDGTNLNKLKADVRKLTSMIKTKFSTYLSKLNKPVEQAQFLTTMAQEIGVPLNKLSSIINTFKDIAGDEEIGAPITETTNESKVMTKKDLAESIEASVEPKVIKTIKRKDIK